MSFAAIPEINRSQGVKIAGGLFLGYMAYKVASNPVLRNPFLVKARIATSLRNFYYGNTKEARVLQYVVSTAQEKNPQSVLDALDNYGWNHEFLMSLGDKKGEQFKEIIRDLKPKVTVELGGYMGYSAVTLGMLVRQWGGRVISIEYNPLFAAIATKHIEWAGLQDVVTVTIGSANDRLPRLKKDFGVDKIDALFVDHWKDLYKPDVQTAQSTGLLKKGSVIIADNCRVPGCPAYVEYIKANKDFSTKEVESVLEYSNIVDVMLVSTALHDLPRK